MAERVTGLPAALARRPMQTMRPRDAARVYAHPRPQLKRLVERGVMHRLARGHYVVVPLAARSGWKPTIEAAAAGVAAARFGPDAIVLMGPTAARIHGAIPRALAVGVVAVPEQSRAIQLTDRDGVVQFVTRDTDRLDAVRIDTELGRALVTTVEQTILDLAHRPTLGGVEEREAREAVRMLMGRADADKLERLAAQQNLRAALVRARHWVAE